MKRRSFISLLPALFLLPKILLTKNTSKNKGEFTFDVMKKLIKKMRTNNVPGISGELGKWDGVPIITSSNRISGEYILGGKEESYIFMYPKNDGEEIMREIYMKDKNNAL